MIGTAGRALASAAVATIILVSPVVAEQAVVWKCNAITKVSLDERIAACTSVLEEEKYGRQGTIRARFNRARAYNEKGEFAQAIADYDALIELYPTNMYAYISRAISFIYLGDPDRAIADYDRTLELSPKNRVAHHGRGIAYHRKGDYDSAVADFTAAIQLWHQARKLNDDRRASSQRDSDPLPAAEASSATAADVNDVRLLVARGAAYSSKGDLDRAFADYDQAIRLDPKYAPAYRWRAIAHLQRGSRVKSLADLDESSSLDPKSGYAALWREIIGNRSDRQSRIAESAKQLDMTKWPAPIVRLFLGEMTAEEVLAAADDKDPAKKRGQVCEANFYTAELALQQGARERARQLLDLAIADCPKTFLEWLAAGAELKALNATP